MLHKRHWHSPKSPHPSDWLEHYLSDIIYGGNDGIVTTFAVVSGAIGAQLRTSVIIILGFVSLLADGFSMGASRYLSIRSEPEAASATRGHWEPLRHAGTTCVAFILLGTIPLLGFLSPLISATAF